MGKSALLIILALAVSVKSQSECPGQLSIVPCICNIFDGRPSIECSQINDEDELEDIFSADFPDPDIQFFTLTNSNLPRLTRNVFGNVTFDDIYIRVDYLGEISDDAFANSDATLRNLELVDCPVTTSSFSFANLERFSQLVQLTLRNNELSEFPREIASESLRFLFIVENEFITDVPSDALTTIANLTSLDLQGNGITTLENTAFRGSQQLTYLSLRDNSISVIEAQLFSYLPVLTEINLSDNQIAVFGIGALTTMPELVSVNLGHNNLTEIDDGTFIYNPELENIDLIYNSIGYIQPGTFDFLPKLQLIDLGYNSLSRLVTEAFRGVNVTTLYVDYNDIDYIEPNAFGNVEESYVNIMGNELTDLYEYWLRPLLDADNEVLLLGNPTTCGCEIAWIFEEPAYVGQLSVRCANGTNLDNLDPAWYEGNC